MRVMMVAHAWYPGSIGGTELYVHGLIGALESRGVVCGRVGPHNVSKEADFLRRLAEFVPDVVHVHHLAGLPLSLPALARKSGSQVVITLHDHHLWCMRGQLADAAGRACPGPTPGACARCVAPRGAGWLPGRTRAAATRAEAARSALNAAHLVLAPSRAVAARCPVPTVACPLPLPRPVNPAPVVSPGPVRFLFVGSLLPTKGIHVLTKAWSRLPAGLGTLTLVGPPARWDGRLDHVERLREAARRLPGLRLVEGVRPEQIESLYAEHDVLLIPSTWEENSPLVALEGRAAGLVRVVSNVGGLPEVAPDAVWVPPGDVAGWAAAMVAEARRGRRRVPAVAPIGLSEHADWLVRRYHTRGNAVHTTASERSRA